MKRFTTLVTTLLALSLWAGSNQPAIADQGPTSTTGNQHHDPKSKGKPGHDRNDDSDRDHDKGKGKDDRHDPRNCDDDRHDHGNAHPKPPKPPKPPKDPVDVPAVPTALTAEALSLFQVNLIWADNSTNELGFKIERSLNGKDFTQIAQLLPNTTKYRDLNRFPDTKYFYRARAFGAKGESAQSNVARTKTPAPECRLSVIASSGIGYGNPALDNYELVAIAAGEYRRLALKADRTVIDLANYAVNQVSNLTDVVAIAAGDIHGLALKNDGTVVGWGEDNYYGQATPPPNLTNITAIAAGSAHSLALKNDGTVLAWGDDTWWQARPPTNLTGVVAIAGGLYHSLALRSDGTVVGWGFNDQNASQPPPGLQDVIAIAAGSSHSLALRNDGTVVGWGNSVAAIIPTNLCGVVAIAAGDNFSAALRSDGSVTGWGYNGVFPTPVASLDTGFTNVVALKIGGQNSMMLTTLPSNPSVLEIKLHTNNQVYLHWDDASVGETGYLVERDLVETSGDYVENWELIAAQGVNSTNFVDESAIAGETYAYAVRAQNSCGISPRVAAGIVAISPPTNAPYFTSVTARGDDALLSFAMQSWSGASFGIEEYRLEHAADEMAQPGAWREIAVVQPHSSSFYYSQETSYTNLDLLLNSTNWYRVRAVNGLGTSPYSQPQRVIIQPLSAPRYLTATFNDTDHVRLSWSADYWHETAGFRIERATNFVNGPDTWEELAILPATNPPAFEYADTTAQAGFTYWYRIRVFNEVGTSDYSLPASVELLAPPVASLSAFAFTNTVFLSAYPAIPGIVVTPAQSPEFERAEDVNGAPGLWTSIAPQPQFNPFLFADMRLTANKTYWYRARLLTWLGETPFSSPVSVTIIPPPPPQEVRAQIGSTNHITLRWRPTYRYDLWAGNIQEQSGFKIQRTIDSTSGAGDWTEIATLGLTNSRYYSFEDTVSDLGQTYRYRVAAVNAVGESIYIESFPIRLIPPPQPTLGASVYINQVQLGFNLPVLGMTGFRLERAPDVGGNPGDWSSLAIISTVESYGSYTDSLPWGEASYWYRVQAYNWVGNSVFSDPVLTQIRPPQAPQILSAKIGNINEVALFWNYVSSDVDELQIDRARYSGSELGAWTTIATLTASPGNYPGIGQAYTDSNAVAHAEYAYRLRTANAIGSSAYSELFRVNVSPPPPLDSLQAAFFGGRVGLSYYRSAGYYDYGAISGFEVERAIELEGTPGNWIRIGATEDYPSIDLSPPANATCRYRVRAINWIGGSDYLESASVNIVSPESPRNLTAKVGSTNQVELLWLAPPANEQDGFELEFAENNSGQPGLWQPLAQIAATNLWGANFTQTNAMAFATNWYRVRAFNPAGFSAYTEPLQFIVSPPPVPVLSAPTQFADQVNLAWNVYTSGTLGGFQLERAMDFSGTPGAWTKIALVPATNSFSGWWYASYADAGRSVDTTYWYRVRAFNWVGTGEASTSVKHTVKGPTAPYLLNTRIGSTNEILISWFPGYSDVTQYELEQATDAGGVPGAWRLLATVPNSGHLLKFTDTNITSLATNWYRVRAVNVLGVSAHTYSLPIAIVPPPPPVLYDCGVFANQLRLKWYLPGANYGEVSGSKLERAIDESGVPGVWSEIQNLPKDQPWADYQEFVDANLSPDTTYYYRLRSYNWLGDGPYSPTTNLTIIPPRSPLNLIATIHGTDFVELFWNAAPPQDQDGYKLERSTDAQNTWTELALIPATNYYYSSYVDTNFVPNVTNYYRVRAFNIVGESPYSTAAQAIISLPTALTLPAVFQIESLTITNHDILISWTAPAGSINLVETTTSLDNNFTPIGTPVIPNGAGNVTASFLDVGALTNSTSRFYRILIVK